VSRSISSVNKPLGGHSRLRDRSRFGARGIGGRTRWLVEEEGRGLVPGDTYVDKARESLRRALERD
jgi:hypothetical protein